MPECRRPGWSARRGRSSATTRPTPRCSPRRWSAHPRARWRPSCRAASGPPRRHASSGSRSPGPGFLNLHMSEAWFRGAAASIAARGRDFGSGVAERPVARPGRVRQRQPDRAADGRQRPAPGLRRLARPDPRASRGHEVEPRVLPQRRRQPDRPVRRVDRGPDRRDGGPGGRLRGRLRRPSSARGSRPSIGSGLEPASSAGAASS